ncbi:MAG: hypothetical protein GVY19_05305 [Bacteroidetes bacterium]|jgi:hypothetical protein|nr:hypothetical protein [Bacteroidota bacterium]
MRTTLLIAAILMAITSLIKAQELDNEANASYGIAMSQNHTGSGHGSNVALSTNVRKANKTLEVGAIFNDEENRISGADIKYKVFLGTPNEFVYKSRKVKTFFQYNCMYQKRTTEKNMDLAGNFKSTGESPTMEGEVSTIEHYVGIGMQVKLMNRMHLEGSMGAGGYIGSVKHDEGGARITNQSKNGGYTLSFKIGVGYAFN